MKSGYLHIETIIEMLKEQEPQYTNLFKHLEDQAPCKWLKLAYIPIISSDRANQPGSHWQFEGSVVLECEENVDIILDILKGDRLGGIEMTSHIP